MASFVLNDSSASKLVSAGLDQPAAPHVGDVLKANAADALLAGLTMSATVEADSSLAAMLDDDGWIDDEEDDASRGGMVMTVATPTRQHRGVSANGASGGGSGGGD